LQEVISQRQQLTNLREAADIAQEDYRRLEALHASDRELVSEHQLRRQQNAYQRARADYDAAQASYPHAETAAKKAVEAAEANHKFATMNREQLQAVDQSEAIVLEAAAAEEARDESLLRAPKTSGGPADYTVLKINMQPGEFITQMPVMQIGNLDEMVCIAEVYEADVKEIYVGQTALIRSAAFEGEHAEHGEMGGIRGRVTRIGTLISDPGLIPRNPLAPSDRSVVEVVVTIDADDEAAVQQAARRIGLQVTVEFGEKPSDSQSATAAADVEPDAEGET
jgi:HlyD family secretion protein